MTPKPTPTLGLPAEVGSRWTVLPDQAEQVAKVVEYRHVRVDKPLDDDTPTIVVLAVEGDGWIKLPLALARSGPGAINQAGLELGIIAGFILRHWELHGYSPTLRKLQELSGRGRGRVLQSIKRLEDLGIISKRLVKFNAEGKEGWKWRFEIPEDSLLNDCRQGVNTKGRAWVLMPEQVARFRSTLAASLAIIADEITRKDGALIGTPTMFAKMLGCSRSTTTRLLHQIGAVRVGTSSDGSIVYQYTRPVPRTGRTGEMKVAGSWLPYDGKREAVQQRLEEILAVINRHTPEGRDTGVAQAAANIAQAGGSVETLARLLEETHLSQALRDPHARKNITRLMSWRLRSKYHRIAPAITREARRQRRVVLRRAAMPATACVECDDMHHVETSPGLWDPCPTCRPMAAAPPD